MAKQKVVLFIQLTSRYAFYFLCEGIAGLGCKAIFRILSKVISDHFDIATNIFYISRVKQIEKC